MGSNEKFSINEFKRNPLLIFKDTKWRMLELKAASREHLPAGRKVLYPCVTSAVKTQRKG